MTCVRAIHTLMQLLLLGGFSLCQAQPDAESKTINEIVEQLDARKTRYLQCSLAVEYFYKRGAMDRTYSEPLIKNVPPSDTTYKYSTELSIDFDAKLARMVRSQPIVLATEPEHRIDRFLTDVRVTGNQVLLYYPEKSVLGDSPRQPDLVRIVGPGELYNVRLHLDVNAHLPLYWVCGRVAPIVTLSEPRSDAGFWVMTNRDAVHPDGRFGPGKSEVLQDGSLRLRWTNSHLETQLSVKRNGNDWIPTELTRVSRGDVDRRTIYEFQWRRREDKSLVPQRWSVTSLVGDELKRRLQFRVTDLRNRDGRIVETIFPKLPDNLVGLDGDTYFIANESGEFEVEVDRESLDLLKVAP